MQQLFERVAGLDVHRKTIAVCVRVPGEGPERAQHVRTFGTTAPDLVTLRDWLEAYQVSHVARESTGVYWKPVFYVLEEAMTCLLVNATHVKKLPRPQNRRAGLHLARSVAGAWAAAGQLRATPAAARAARSHPLYRKVLIQERTREANRLHKVLEDADIKLATVAADILGVSGRDMLHALVAGTTDPDLLADLARGVLRKKLPALRQALTGRFRPHHAFMVSQHLGHLDYLDEAITTLSTQIEQARRPFATEQRRLDSIPGVARRTAEVLIAEIGVDVRPFPPGRALGQLWAGLCPGQNEAPANTNPAASARATAGCA